MTLVEKLQEKKTEYATIWCSCDDDWKDGYAEGLKDAMKDSIDIVTSHSDWIPISNHQRPTTDDCDLSDEILFQLEDGTIEKGRYWSKCEPTWEGNYTVYAESDVVAWQPLPEPYKGE